jgi:hypothetical protein
METQFLTLIYNKFMFQTLKYTKIISGGAVICNSIFLNVFYYYLIPTTRFGPYGPSSGGIFTVGISHMRKNEPCPGYGYLSIVVHVGSSHITPLGAIYATTDPLFFPSYQLHIPYSRI